MPIQKQGSNGNSSTSGSWETDLDEHSTVVESLEQQLESLYAEREQLARAIGVTDADDIIAMVRSSSSLDGSPDGTESLIQQLHSLYADKDRLRQHLGTAEPEEIIDLCGRSLSPEAATSLTSQLESLYGERDVLLSALGTCDAHEIVAKFRALEGRLDVILALIDNLNTLLKEKR